MPSSFTTTLEFAQKICDAKFSFQRSENRGCLNPIQA